MRRIGAFERFDAFLARFVRELRCHAMLGSPQP